MSIDTFLSRNLNVNVLTFVVGSPLPPPDVCITEAPELAARAHTAGGV